MSVAQICYREVSIAGEDTTVLQTAKLMYDSHVDFVVIISLHAGERVPSALVNSWNIISCLFSESEDLDNILVSNIQTSNYLTVDTNESLPMALKRMREEKVKYAIVVNENGGLYGVLTIVQILDNLLEQLYDVSQINIDTIDNSIPIGLNNGY